MFIKFDANMDHNLNGVLKQVFMQHETCKWLIQ